MGGYCLDTSALIGCWSRSYPPDIFPGFWDRLDGLLALRQVVSPEEVKIELRRQSDDLAAWARNRTYMFVALDEPIQLATRDVLRTHPLLMKATKNRNGADPFVIATAEVMDLTVVTEEIGGSELRPKIPSVCSDRGVRCIDPLAFIREQGWNFA